MQTRWMLAAAISTLSTGFCLQGVAQTAVPPTAAPAAVASGSANLDALHLRSLQAVLDARDRRQDWHDAAQQAEASLQVPAMKDQLTQRLSGLAPRVAKELAAHPQDDALVSVDVFKDPGADGKQAMVSVTFEGLGSSIGSDYFFNVLAGQSKPPQAEGVPANLVPDPEASSYLVFFLGNHSLQAGDIPQVKMRQSVLAAINHLHQVAAHQDQLAIEEEKAREQQANLQQQATEQAQVAANQQIANQQGANQQQQVIPEYPYGVGGAAPNGYEDGYYYPGMGVPIVITPDGYANTPQWRDHEKSREQALEKTYAGRNPGSGNSGQARTTTPPEGVSVPPGSVGVRQPAGAIGVRQPPAQGGVREPAASAGARQPAAEGGTRSTAGQSGGEHPAPAPVAHEAASGGGHPAGGGAGEKK
jgi:hypothetical protein